MHTTTTEEKAKSQAWAKRQTATARADFESWVSRAMPRAVGTYTSKSKATVTCGGNIVANTAPERIRRYYSEKRLCAGCQHMCHKNRNKT